MMYAVMPFLAALGFLGTGLVVWRLGPRNPLTPSFLLLCVTTMMWQGVWGVLFLLGDLEWTAMVVTIGYSFILFLPTAMYHFLSRVCHRSSERPWVLGSYALSVLCLVLLLFTHTMIVGVYQYGYGYYPKAGPLLWVHILHTTLVVCRSLWMVFKTRQHTTGHQRTQLTYVGWGLVIYSMAAVDYAGNYGVSIYPPGVWFLWAYLIIVGYAISKYDLIAIPVVIGRTVAFVMTAAIFWVGYLAIWWVMDGWSLTTISTGWWMVTGVYFLGGVAPFFRSVQHRLQTSAYRRFLNLRYEFEDIIQTTSHELVAATTREDVMQAIYHLQENLDIVDSYAIVKTDAGFFECRHMTPLAPARSSVLPDRIPVSHCLIRSLPLRAIMDSRSLDREAQEWVKQLTHRRRTLVLAIHAFDQLEAVFLLGPKVSEEAYTKKDEALFQIVLNHARTVVERIEKTTVTHQLMGELEDNNAQLEAKATAAIELAKQHFHQSAMASLSAGIAHEIRNPMAAILGSSENLALSLGAMQSHAVGGRMRMTPDPLARSSTDWQVPLSTTDLMVDVGGDAALARLLDDGLRAQGWVDDNGLIRGHFNKPLPPWSDHEWPIALIPHRDAIQLRMRWIHAMGLTTQFLTVVSVQIPRILAITDTMMKYGVSGGGIHRFTFAKLEGIDNEQSGILFQVLGEEGFIDQNGRGLPALYDDREALLTTIRRVLPASLQHQVIPLVSLLHHIPGGSKRPVDLAHLLKQTVGMLEGECNKKGIRINGGYPSHTVWVRGDEHRLQQAFLNILLNAKQSMEKTSPPSGGHQLTLRLDVMDEGVGVSRSMVSISDTGAGMTPDQKEKIFDPFFTTKSGGASHNIGLGLSILKEVIVTHEGVIEVESAPNEGTVFRVLLPTHAPD